MDCRRIEALKKFPSLREFTVWLGLSGESIRQQIARGLAGDRPAPAARWVGGRSVAPELPCLFAVVLGRDCAVPGDLSKICKTRPSRALRAGGC